MRPVRLAGAAAALGAGLALGAMIYASPRHAIAVQVLIDVMLAGAIIALADRRDARP